MTRAGFGKSFGFNRSGIREIARGMTDVDVGSSALLGLCNMSNTPELIRARHPPKLPETKPAIARTRSSPCIVSRKQSSKSPDDRATKRSGVECLAQVRLSQGSSLLFQTYPLHLALTKSCPTSKMSHDGSGRASCSRTMCLRLIHFNFPSIARGVTDPDVGSGALFGFCFVESAILSITE